MRTISLQDSPRTSALAACAPCFICCVCECGDAGAAADLAATVRARRAMQIQLSCNVITIRGRCTRAARDWQWVCVCVGGRGVGGAGARE